MNWYYESAGKPEGPVPEDEFDRLIAAGEIAPDTRVWRQGMPDWLPLREARQGDNANPDVPTKEAPVTLSPDDGTAPSLSRNRLGPAWERRAELGLVTAAWRTVTAVLTRPGDTFSTMRRDGGLGGPMLFAMVLGGVGWAALIGYTVAFQGFTQKWHVQRGMNPEMAAQFHVDAASAAILVLLGPGFTALFALFLAGVTHLLLMLFNGANHNFETTSRVVCYAIGAAAPWLLLPFVGGYAAIIGLVMAMIIGLARAHETGTAKSAGAVLVPMLTCCGFAYTIYLMAATIVAEQLKAMAG